MGVVVFVKLFGQIEKWVVLAIDSTRIIVSSLPFTMVGSASLSVAS